MLGLDPDHITEWLLAFALTLVAAAVAVRVVRLFWDAKRTIDEAALDAAVARHPSGSKLPGPSDVQAARWPDEDTGISDEQFSRELRKLLDREPPR